MAFQKGPFHFTGNIGGLSFYYMKGYENPIVRRPGGPTKKMVKESESCRRVRENNEEFRARSISSGTVRMALWEVHKLADYNFINGVHSIAALVQKMDRTSKRGERQVLFSQHKHLLNNFNLNQKHPFNTVITHQISPRIQRTEGKVDFYLPALIPNISLFLPWTASQYRLICGASVVHDLEFVNGQFQERDIRAERVMTETAWLPADKAADAQNLTVQFAHPDKISEFSSIVSYIAIETLVLFPGKGPLPVRLGSAKILEVG